jgi:AraC-like DNA-binding protein
VLIARVLTPLFSNSGVTGLPELVTLDLAEEPALRDTAAAFMTEVAEFRRRLSAALSRLCEVVMLLVLRSAIDQGDARPGLLAGLAYPFFHRALVAIHDDPAPAWNLEDLAREAGMSRCHFMHHFPELPA